MPVVAVALLDHAGRVLMQKRPDDAEHGGLWEFPGGKVERDEVPEKALIREVAEELSIDIAPLDPQPVSFAQGTSALSGRHIVILLYTLSLPTDLIAAIPSVGPSGENDWFDARQIAKLAKPPLDIALAENLFSLIGAKGLPSS